jgi:hypothetical protein
MVPCGFGRWYRFFMVDSVRVSLLAFSLALAGCSVLPRRPLVPVLPASFENWDRAGLDTPPVDQAPEAIRALKPLQWVRASYRNKHSRGSVLVEAFGMPTDASAFEAQQKWRNEPGAVSFRNGNVFAVLSSPTETTQSLIALSKKLETEWLRSSQ